MRKIVLGGLLGIVVGVIAWGGFNTALEATNKMSFCISCHVMRDTVYAEYLHSPHYKNPSGVRATCPDCHVPRDWTHKVSRKIQATNELYHWVVGSIDTPEKFAAKRHQLAKREWERMRTNNSAECRNCHSFEAMDFHKQPIKASRAMRDAAKIGKTCIDCHKAVAHKMPDVTAVHRRMFQDLTPASVAAGDTVVALDPQPIAASQGGEPIGQLTAGLPVRILAVENDFARVELAGWRREGKENTLYLRQGQRIELAALDLSRVEDLRSLAMVEDAQTGHKWTEVRLEAWAPASRFLRDTKPLWKTVRRLYEDNCSLCHALHSPDEYSANNWIGHVNSMARLTPLTGKESALLLAWLQTTTKK